MKLGDAVLASLTSKLGDLDSQEGIVIADKTISSEPFKIVGKFIVKGLESVFR